MTTPSFEFRIKAGFAAVALILALVVFLAIGNSRQFREASSQAAQSQETLRELERTLATVVDAETGMRGFLLTGQDPYLEPFYGAVATIDGRMAHLKGLLKESGSGNDRLDELQRRITEQIDFRKSVVEHVKADGGSEWARLSIRIDEGKEGMDRVREIINNFQASQERALARRRELSEQSDRRAVGTLIAFVTVTVVLLIGGIALVRHHLAARAKLEEERTRFFTLSHDLYCIAGTDGYFKEVNPAAERILGYTAEDMKSRPFIEWVHPEDRAATIAESQKLADGERTIYFENRYLTKDGSYKWMLWSAAPVPADKLIYAVARDISEHKEAERQMAAMTAEMKERAVELESLNKELEAFSYSVSHDLRAPLRHIAGFSDMLQRYAEASLDDKGKRFLKTIIDSAKRMGMLIDDLLVFSRMGRTEMRREQVDSSAMVDEVIAGLAPEMAARKIDWKKAALPPVFVDKSMLRQVWVNLLSNAVKYTGGREVADIQVGSRDENGEMIFFVRDNGAGFDMAYAHKLFGVFQRLHEASQFEGTGIGLANVRRIVARHGGRTWAEAELDKGATFYFSIPKAKLHAAT